MQETKYCPHCEQFKPLDKFYKKRAGNGVFSICIDCRRVQGKEYWEANKERLRQWTRERYYRNKERHRAIQRRYSASEKGRAMQRRKYQRRKAKDLNKVRVRAALSHAIADGKLPSASRLICSECGKQAEQYHHHLGYEPEHWLDVIPLCKKCHDDIHREDYQGARIAA